MKKSLLLLFVSFGFAALFFSCKKDTSVKTPDMFDLYLVNKTKQNFNIYITANMDDDGFVNEGILPVDGSKTIEDLIINITYTVRVMKPGKAPDEGDDIYKEITFTNESSSNKTITEEID